jgi:anaerobic selenocysteine-containing dehydrogenase
MSQVQTVKTICGLCTNHCGMDVQVQDGQILKVSGMPEHPFHHLCVKPYAYQELVYSEERATTPLIKKNGAFKEISWEDAFDLIADKLTKIKNQYGPKSLVPFCGNGFACRSNGRVIRRFADLLGTPNFITGGWTCFSARVMAFTLTVGGFPNPDFVPENKCLILWGKNPPESLASEKNQIEEAFQRGTKFIVIDPRATPLAKRAELHAQIRPGTDCALALGILHVIIGEGLYDKEFVANWTVGFDKLVDHIKDFSPAEVEKITWVPAETVRKIARMYATNSPAGISTGISLDHSSNGIQTMRAIGVLMAICGNLEIPGGNLIHRGIKFKHMNMPEKISKEPPIGAEFPLFTKIRGHQSGTRVTNAILTEKPYPIKALLVLEGNPMVNWPNTNKVRKAFEKLDFLLVQDMFLTDTAKMAHLFLPATSDLETEDFREGYFDHECLPLIAKSNRVIEPVGKCMEDWKIWAEVGRRMGLAEYFPWKSTSEYLADLVEPTNLSYEDLQKNPGGLTYSPKSYRSYLNGGFKTASQKVEIYSETMAQSGYDGLPTFHEPFESPVSKPELAATHPLILITGARTEGYTHSRFRNMPSLRKLYPEPLVEIHPQTAKSLGVEDGEWVRVESLRGGIRVKARLTEVVHPRIVSVTHGWSNATGANINCLTDDQAVDPVSGFPEYRSLLCRVVKE